MTGPPLVLLSTWLKYDSVSLLASVLAVPKSDSNRVIFGTWTIACTVIIWGRNIES